MAYCNNVDRKMKKGNFKTLPMKNLVLGIWSEKRMKQKTHLNHGQITFSYCNSVARKIPECRGVMYF